MTTEKEFYESLSDELKADIRTVISDKTKLMEVARKYNLTYRRGGKEYAKTSILSMIATVKKFEV